MALPWFRFYHEWASDMKVQTLSFENQRHFVMILCWHASGVLPTLTDEVIAAAFRMTAEDLAEMKKVFRSRGFIEKGWQPKNWDKRQRPSDDSGARVKAHRERKKQVKPEAVTVTTPLRNGDVTEIPLISYSSSVLEDSLNTENQEEDTRCKSVTTPLRNGYTADHGKPCPAYPDPETSLVIIHTGGHTIADDAARDLWRRIWATWKDEKLCLGWYEHQRWYPAETWVSAFAETKKQYGDRAIGIRLVEKIAADIDAHGTREAKPFAPDPTRASAANGKPKSEKQQWREANSAHLAMLKEKLAQMGGDDDGDETES